MKTAIAAALAICLALPAHAGQETRPWWDCTMGYLSKRDLVNGKPLDIVAYDATWACSEQSIGDLSHDYDVILALITRYRSYHNEPAPAASKYDRHADEMVREGLARPGGLR